MFKKKERLTRNEFDRSFSNGKRIHTPELQLIYDKTTDFHGSAVVGKKVFKKAVDRNRLRRQVYGALYRFHKKNNLSGTYIIVAKPPSAKLHAKQVAPAVEELLKKVV